MAVRANADQVAADMRPADFRGAVKRLRGIQAKKERIGSVNGEIADIYAKVESLKVNKKAARIFLTLDKLEADERADVMRSINGLVDSADWDAGGDLVDAAEGNEKSNLVHFPTGKPSEAEGENDAGEDEGIANAMDQVDAMPAENRTTSRNAAAAARKRAKEHLGVQEDARSAPYTGDNSDLNPE